MPRYVDIEHYKDYKIVLHKEDNGFKCSELPIADVQKIIRCKDCKFAVDNGSECCSGGVYCTVFPKYVKKDFFCAAGEKREKDV